MITAQRLFAGQALTGKSPVEFSGVARDSRQVKSGAAFVAVSEKIVEREAHLTQAVANGAAACVCETPAAAIELPTLLTPHSRWAFARANAAAMGVDRSPVPILGVTGSAGKSTTTHCAWWALGEGAARIGTLGWHDGKTGRDGKQTTPPPEEIHDFLAGLDKNCPGMAIEISSHAGDQQRMAGLPLAGLVFTGLGHDHLDYHRSIGAYLTAKLKIVRWLKAGAPCIINAEDPHYHVVAHAARNVGAVPIGLGYKRGEARLVGGAGAWRLVFGGADHPLPVRLPGAFNAWNAAAGALLASATGVSLSTALARLATLEAVPGRLELLARSPLTYVDYAHTPESISTMVQTLRGDFPDRRLVCVFGCGGDRDRTKRGPMGRAALMADIAVLTTDNSRSEAPQAIADDVLAGIPADMRDRLQVELDRAHAIHLARDLAGKNGVVVVAGKGHETSQEIQGIIHPWDDRAFVASLERT